jgi:hypothetical protein
MMDATSKLFKFAIECEDMAKRADGINSKEAWRNLAQRWRECAKINREHGVALHASLEEKYRQPRARASRIRGRASPTKTSKQPEQYGE